MAGRYNAVDPVVFLEAGILCRWHVELNYDRDGARNFGLRSRPDGADVSKICALYGGGGHRGAGGFQRPQGWEGDDV
jgi:nanoRNase/pAp phosphatase (c-di-AMP/oligoRNAs hydrolase)